VVAVDLGDLPQRGTPQSMLKYTTAMRALKLLDYTAVSFGEQEMAMAASSTHWRSSFEQPVAARGWLQSGGRGKNEVFDTMVHAWAIGAVRTKRRASGCWPGGGRRWRRRTRIPASSSSGHPKVLRERWVSCTKTGGVGVLLYQGSITEATLCAPVLCQ